MIKKYIGLLLKASGMDKDDFWSSRFSGEEEIVDGFYAFSNCQSADRLAHEMHTQNLQLRRLAIEVIKEVSEDSEYEYEHLFDSRDDAQMFCDKLNDALNGYIAKSYVRETWIYDHVDRSNGLVNPYIVVVDFWKTDLTKSVVESIIKEIENV